jgi:hypothetical protein
VLSRQQTELNRLLVGAIRELAEKVESLERRLDDASFSGKPKAPASDAGAFGLPLDDVVNKEIPA